MDEDKIANAALVISQSASMLAELEAMKVANMEREQQGLAYAYDEKAFAMLPDKYALGWNTVIELIRGA